MYPYYNREDDIFRLQTDQLVDPEKLKGAPVALQLVGAKWKDAELLRDVELVEAALRL